MNPMRGGGILFTVTQLKQTYQINERMCVCTSCGTSCRRSRARMWSRVSMEGDKPPWRQKIWERNRRRTSEYKDKADWLLWRETSVIPVGQPARWAAGSRTSLWSTSRRWRCRTSSDTRHRSRRLVWSVATRGSLAGWWFAPGNEPEPKKEETILLKLRI